MTEEHKKQRRQEREALIERIFDLALDLTIRRPENIDAKETTDNVAFDRLARTAQVLFRIVDEADALAARQRKEETDNDKTGAGADEERIERDVAVLKRRLHEELDRLTGGGAARGDRCDVEERSAGGGDRA